MKPTAVLINVTSAEIIDAAALYQALTQRTIAGAGLDVWYRYPTDTGPTLPACHAFRELPNVLMTPHVSGWTEGTCVPVHRHPRHHRRVFRPAYFGRIYGPVYAVYCFGTVFGTLLATVLRELKKGAWRGVPLLAELYSGCSPIAAQQYHSRAIATQRFCCSTACWRKPNDFRAIGIPRTMTSP
jgi:hypothetical protein